MLKIISSPKFKSNDQCIFVLCAAMLIVLFIIDVMFGWTAGGILYVLVIILSLRSTKDRNVYFFTVITSLLLLASWKFSVSTTKIWHVSIVIVCVTALSGVHIKKVHIIKSSLASIVNFSQDAIIGKTLSNKIFSWNKAAEIFFGYECKEILGHSSNCLIPEERIDAELRIWEKVKEGKEIKHYQTVFKHKNGKLIHMSVTLSQIKDPFGNTVGISSICRDISDQIDAERKLKVLNDKIFAESNKIKKVLSMEEHLNAIFDLNKLIDFVVDKISEVLEAEKCSLMMVDYHTRELCIKGHKGLDSQVVTTGDYNQEKSVSRIIAYEAKPILVVDIEEDKRFLRKKRESYRTKSFISAPIRSGGIISGFVNVADKSCLDEDVFTDTDIKILSMIVRQVAVAMENAKMYRELKHLTITDSLTQMYNYRHFVQSLDHEIIRLKRYPGSLCIFMIDIDEFKEYNDIFGHLEGDILLKELSAVFIKNIREVDIACRYGGDEFVIILPQMDFDGAIVVAERIRSAVKAISLKQKISISIGVANCTNFSMNRYDLVLKADTALYEAKKKGKNTIHILK